MSKDREKARVFLGKSVDYISGYISRDEALDYMEAALSQSRKEGEARGIERAAQRLEAADGNKEPLEPSALAKVVRALKDKEQGK